jgi:hypothetical protein
VYQGRLDTGVVLMQKPLTQASLAAKIREVLGVRLVGRYSNPGGALSNKGCAVS